jgi:hypothetical protein
MKQFGKHTDTELSKAKSACGIKVNGRLNRTAACQNQQPIHLPSFFSTFLFSYPPQKKKKKKKKKKRKKETMAELKLEGRKTSPISFHDSCVPLPTFHPSSLPNVTLPCSPF